MTIVTLSTHHTADSSNRCESFKVPFAVKYAAHTIVNNHTLTDAPVATKC